jgi:plastocyanin
MRTRRSVCWTLHAAGCLAALTIGSHGSAATLEVAVTDERGRPVERVAVYATPAGAPAAAADRPSAVMDQQRNAFVPHLLVVQTGTAVLFPNNDTVSHHVYSFSAAKSFELGLYKGEAYPPLVFDTPGVVVLGCNIHDGMLGYILVVSTPHFALTDERGVALLEDLPAGSYTVEAWTPRARQGGLPAAQTVELRGAAALAVRITGRLSPRHDHGASSLSWERY